MRIEPERRGAKTHSNRRFLRRASAPRQGMQREDAGASFAARRPIAAERRHAARDDQFQHALAAPLCGALEFATQRARGGCRDLQPRAPVEQPFEMIVQEPNPSAAYPHGLEHAVAVLQAAVSMIDSRAPPAVDPRAQLEATRARSKPSALARVSANSWRGFESATMPAPARNLKSPLCAVMVRIKILRS